MKFVEMECLLERKNVMIIVLMKMDVTMFVMNDELDGYVKEELSQVRHFVRRFVEMGSKLELKIVMMAIMMMKMDVKILASVFEKDGDVLKVFQNQFAIPYVEMDSQFEPMNAMMGILMTMKDVLVIVQVF